MFQPLSNPFSKYTDRLEKKLDRVLRNLAFVNNFTLQRNLEELMQQNLVVVSLWLEKEFKGYKVLNKRYRRRLYANAAKIAERFLEFSQTNKISEDALSGLLMQVSARISGEQFEKIKSMAMVMAFLQPGKRYEYLEGASFRKLLVDIDKEKMIGDCNQIVTLYTFLYSLLQPVSDLKIKLLPGHVCLNLAGIDIEATNASFQKYKQFEHILPITELISTNLLDVSDFRDKQLNIDLRVMLRGAQLARGVSSLRELVEGNLKVVYNRLALESVKKGDFQTAKFFVEKTQDDELKAYVFQQAVTTYSQRMNYMKARYYADLIPRLDLRKYVDEQEAFSLFKSGSYERALTKFQASGNAAMVRECYKQEYNVIQNKVARIKTVVEAKQHRADYERMLQLARLAGEDHLVQGVEKVLRSL